MGFNSGLKWLIFGEIRYRLSVFNYKTPYQQIRIELLRHICNIFTIFQLLIHVPIIPPSPPGKESRHPLTWRLGGFKGLTVGRQRKEP
jgi:hypothetical protein